MRAARAEQMSRQHVLQRTRDRMYCSQACADSATVHHTTISAAKTDSASYLSETFLQLLH